MNNSKIIYGDQVLIDLTNDTVAASNLLQGYTAHGANGELITGTATGFAPITFSGDCSFLNYNGKFDWMFENYADSLTFQNVTNLSDAFYQSNLVDLSNITIEGPRTGIQKLGIQSAFGIMPNLQYLPTVKYVKATAINTLGGLLWFDYNLKEIPADWMDTWTIDNVTNTDYVFQMCYSLREIPFAILQKLIQNIGLIEGMENKAFYNGAFEHCACLDSVNLPVGYKYSAFTHNTFYNTFNDCYRLSDITFDPYDETTDWYNQTIDLSNYVGFANPDNIEEITNYSSGITNATRIYDNATYQQYYSNPNCWTTEPEWSRYNLISAINTIFTLPSVVGNCVIKFLGESGSGTYGGAIRDMTPDIIAEAADKGWTVAIV